MLFRPFRFRSFRHTGLGSKIYPTLFLLDQHRYVAAVFCRCLPFLSTQFACPQNIRA
jgi:hypothetical protein